jgi:hypothetical protein
VFYGLIGRDAGCMMAATGLACAAAIGPKTNFFIFPEKWACGVW